MKVRSISYSMLRKTTTYENDRAEVTLELELGDSFESAVERAKELCTEALSAPKPKTRYDRVREKLKARGLVVSAAATYDVLRAYDETS